MIHLKDIFIYLLQAQFVTFHDNGVDTLSHKYWKYYEPDYFPDVKPDEVRRYGNAIPDYYELVDQTLGTLMSHFTDDTLVVVVSDHGQRAANKLGDVEYSPKLNDLLQLMNLDSVAYGIALGGRSYIRLKDSYQTELLANVKKRFGEIRVAETGEALFDVLPDESSLIVEIKGQAVDFNYHVRVGQRELRMEEIIYLTPPYSGVHNIDGILIIKGTHVRSGNKISGATILDVTPTILYLEKMPISQEVDGKILFSAISEDFQKTTSAQFIPESKIDKVTPSQKVEFDKQVEERLKSLGYVQ